MNYVDLKSKILQIDGKFKNVIDIQINESE